MSEVEYYEEALMTIAKKLVKLSDEIITTITENQALRENLRKRKLLDDLFPTTAKIRHQNE